MCAKGEMRVRAGAPAAAAAAASGSAGGVVNLGVVGRGSKRIKLQPAAAEGSDGVSSGRQSAGHTRCSRLWQPCTWRILLTDLGAAAMQRRSPSGPWRTSWGRQPPVQWALARLPLCLPALAALQASATAPALSRLLQVRLLGGMQAGRMSLM